MKIQFLKAVVAVLCLAVGLSAQVTPGTPATGGTGAWGGITGTLADQTDLQTAMDLKAPKASPTFTGTVTLPASTSLTTPVLGVAAATSLNKMAITAPATSSTLAVADGKTATFSNTLTLAGTDASTITFPGATAGVLRETSGNTISAAELSGVVLTSASNVTTPGKADVMQSSFFCADAGANDTYACSLSPAVTAYVAGAHYWFKANTANTGAATVNLNSVGATTIKKAAGGITTDLADNDIRAGQYVDVVYDGTNMEMQSLLGNAAAAAGATTALDNLASVAINSALLAGTDNSIALGSSSKRWSNLFSTAITCGVGGTTSCVITGSGATSGTATITWPTTAGTTTNAFAFSNVIQVPVGSKTLGAGFSFAGAPATGIYQRAGVISLTNGTADLADLGTSSGIAMGTASGGSSCLSASSGDLASVGTDTFLCRTAAGVFSIGNSGTPNSVGALKLSSLQVAGTKFASNAGCTEGTLVGGATAGKFTVGQNTACTIVITMGDTATAPNGWACAAHDQTAVPAVAIRQTASSTTTASLLMTTATSDVVSFHCIGY